MPVEVDCLALLTSGDIMTGITCPFTNMIGPWFYAIMVGALAIMIYIRTENILAPVTGAMFVGILMINYLPPVFQWAIILIEALTVGAVLYLLFIRDD